MEPGARRGGSHLPVPAHGDAGRAPLLGARPLSEQGADGLLARLLRSAALLHLQHHPIAQAHLHDLVAVPRGRGGARANGQESPNHLIVNFSEIHNRMVQDTDPIFFGQKTAKDQMPTVQDDVTSVLQQTR